MIVIFKHIIPKPYSGLTIFPFIFLKSKNYKMNAILVNHEKIHLKQQIELLWVFFFVWYLTEYVFLLIKFRKHDMAYKNISFEKEAYAFENDLAYLNRRKPYSFLKFIR